MTAPETKKHEEYTVNVGGGGAVVRIYSVHGVDDFFHLLFVYQVRFMIVYGVHEKKMAWSSTYCQYYCTG